VWLPPQIFVPVWLFGPFWFISEFWMAAKGSQGDLVAHWVHVGGFCTGLITGLVIRSRHAPAVAGVSLSSPAISSAPQAGTASIAPVSVAQNPLPVAAGLSRAAFQACKPGHPGAPASPCPPIAPRTVQEAVVHHAASQNIHKRKPIAVWIILAFALLVVIGNIGRNVGAAIGAGIFVFLILLGLWTGGEHLLAYALVKMRAKPIQGSPSTS
jgi:hypothetical protein